MNGTTNQNVMIIVPPTMSNMDVSLLLSLYPIPKDAKNKTIGNTPNIGPLCCVSICKKPSPVWPTIVSMTSIENNVTAIPASSVEIVLLLLLLLVDPVCSRLKKFFIITILEDGLLNVVC